MKELAKTKELTLAIQLQAVEEEIENLTTLQKSIREHLLKNLKRQGIRGVKLEDGTHYLRVDRHSVKVVGEMKAWDWAMDNPEARMKIDLFAAEKAFRGKTLPKFFKRQTTEYLTVKRPDHDNA